MTTTTKTASETTFITINQLANILDSIDGKQAMFASIVYQSDARLVKKDRDTKEPCPVSQAWWVSEKTVNLNVNYEASVNRQLDKEGKEQLTFQKADRSWGDQVNDNENGSLVEYKGMYYIQAVPMETRFKNLVDNNGKNIDWLRDWNVFPKKSKPKNQGTDKPIEVRAFRLDRVLEIRLQGKTYKVIHP